MIEGAANREKPAIADRLELALSCLRRLAGECRGCAGTGELREPFEAFLFEDDPRIPARGRRDSLRRARGVLEAMPRAAFWLVSPCQGCAHIRQVIETAGGHA